MDRLIYTSLTAMRGSMARQTAIANNLANAQTPGFRADMAEAQSLWLKGEGFDTRAVASEERNRGGCLADFGAQHHLVDREQLP